MFGYDKNDIEKLGATFTATEISNQPKIWEQTYDIVSNKKDEINTFLKKYLTKDTNIILTGAGTSDYVGDTLERYIAKKTGIKTIALATTDITASYKDYLEKDTPTILVSYARSGNSPESVATFDICNKYIKNIAHIVITCNENGKLYTESKNKDNALCILMPEESNDKGFAMTSSFSSMLLSSILLFDIENIEKNKQNVSNICTQTNDILDNYKKIEDIVNYNFNRVVYLGSSHLKGLAEEAALKNLELTSGKVVSVTESVLGFRHGPKSITDDNTLIFVMCSTDDYTRLYDIDLIKEIYTDKGEHKLIVLDYKNDDVINNNCHNYFVFDKTNVDGIYTIFGYLVFSQIFALLDAIKNKITPDNPRPDGSVNRVVKGVIIHKGDI